MIIIYLFSIDNKPLSINDLKLIDNNEKANNNNYILYFIGKSEKIKIFSVKDKKIFLSDFKIENVFIQYILDYSNYKTINANNSLYIIGENNEVNKAINDYIKKKVCKISYIPNNNKCKIELIKETNINRKNCSLIYCKYYNIIILVGGGGLWAPYSNTAEFLNLSKESKGWKIFKKKTNNYVRNGNLFILNDTKLFLIGGFLPNNKRNLAC